jgi:DNA-directed RNA polymerase subunit K/omega
MEEVNQGQTESEEKKAEIEKLNDYEKVILAAKLARKINDARTAAREQLASEELGKIDQRKVTTVALEELESGTVRINRQKEEPGEETYDLT